MTEQLFENDQTLREQFSMQCDDHWFPFVEDESCNITGYGHQDKAEFAAAINRYDAIWNGVPLSEDDQWDESHIGYAWVTIAADGEHLAICTAETEGAIPVTEMWGQR